MKKMNFIPSLALVCLLSACGTTKAPSMAKPRFAKQGKEIASYEDFSNQFQTVLEESELSSADFKMGDREMNSKAYVMESEIVKRNKKVFTEESRTIYSETLNRFDGDNHIIATKGKTVSYWIFKELDSTHENESRSNENIVYQESTVDGKQYYVNADLNSKTYSNGFELSDTATAEDYYNQMASAVASVLKMTILTFVSLEDIEDFKFYRNDKTFTWSSKTIETEEIKKSEDVVVGTAKLEGEFKAQVDFTDGKASSKLVIITKSTSTFTSDYGDYLTGDILVEEFKEYVDISLLSKNVKNSPVDISKFRHVSA